MVFVVVAIDACRSLAASSVFPDRDCQRLGAL
jgi:hypothetical protein